MLSHNQTAIVLLAMNSAPLGLAVYSSNLGPSPGGSVAALVSDNTPAAPVLRLDSMVVHMAPDDTFDRTEHYAHVEFDLELVREKDREVVAHRRGQIREAVLGYFLDRSVAQIKNVGMVQMKGELVNRINKLSDVKIRSLYFSEFLIQ